MRVLMIEDDEALATSVTSGLKRAGFEVAHENNGPDGLERGTTETFDAMIVDIMLPGLNGVNLIDRLRSRGVDTPILILSAKQTVDDRVRGLRVGGDDYMVKPFAFTELEARLHALLRRSKDRGEVTKMEMDDLVVDLVNREVTRDGTLIDLQNKEFELLAYLLKNRHKVVSKMMIIENVWNFNFDPQTNIVEARLSKLRDKVDKPFGRKLIHTVRGAGYVMREET